MGQDVIIRETTTMGDVLVIDSDRSFTGQDGHMITRDSERYGVPGELAERLFSLDSGIDYIFVLQNIVTVRRSGGWDEETAAQVTDITGSFLRFYPDDERESPDEEEASSPGKDENGADEAESPDGETENEADEEENGADEGESPSGEEASSAEEEDATVDGEEASSAGEEE